MVVDVGKALLTASSRRYDLLRHRRAERRELRVLCVNSASEHENSNEREQPQSGSSSYISRNAHEFNSMSGFGGKSVTKVTAPEPLKHPHYTH